VASSARLRWGEIAKEKDRREMERGKLVARSRDENARPRPSKTRRGCKRSLLSGLG